MQVYNKEPYMYGYYDDLFDLLRKAVEANDNRWSDIIIEEIMNKWAIENSGSYRGKDLLYDIPTLNDLNKTIDKIFNKSSL